MKNVFYDNGENCLTAVLGHLAQEGISSVFVEGGAKTIQSFIDQDLWDEARVFVSPTKLITGIPAPTLSSVASRTEVSGSDELKWFYHPYLEERLGLDRDL